MEYRKAQEPALSLACDPYSWRCSFWGPESSLYHKTVTVIPTLTEKKRALHTVYAGWKTGCLRYCLTFATINGGLGGPRGHLPDDLRLAVPLISGALRRSC